MNESFIMPIGELPLSYRKEIDRGFSTGWKGIDGFLQGLRRGEVTVITADTGVGKTTFTTQLIVNCAYQKIPVWINSWEMSPAVTMRKIASIVLRKPMKILAFSLEDSGKFDQWCSSHKVYVNNNTVGTDINSLGAQLVRAKELGVEVVMLDHLDYIVRSRRQEMHEAIEETVKRLHELAVELQMHFFLICHIKQSANSSEEAGLHSIKGSSAIKQYADNIIVLYRCSRTDQQADPRKVKVKIVKNRMFGIEGATYLFYQPEWEGYVSFKEEETWKFNMQLQTTDQ